MDAVTHVPQPANEPVHQYVPGSHERAAVESKIKELAGERAELTMTIGGRERIGAGEPIEVVAPHNFRHVLGTMRNATDQDVADAIEAAAGGGARLARADVRRPGRDPAQGRRPAERPVAGHDQRRHDLRPVQVGVPGGDRRRLRADRLLALQRALRPAAAGRAAAVRPGHLEPDGIPAARRLRSGHHPLQLHLDRRQPADRAGPARQRRGVEALADAAARRALHDAAARGRRAAAGRDQPGHRRRAGGIPGRAAAP